MSFVISPSVNVFIISGNKLLLGRRLNTGWMDGFLCPPGGHVEEKESPTEAGVREMHEELGLKISAKDLEFICVAARNTSPRQYVAYEFVIRNRKLAFTNTEPDKCSELVWVDMKHLPEDVVPDFREIIARSILGQEKYLELGF